MSRMNAALILGGQQPDFVNALARGQQARAVSDANQRQNALHNVYQTHGEGIARGDQASINALAKVNPAQAQEILSRQELMEQRRADQQIQFDKYARALSAEQAAAEAAEIQRTAHKIVPLYRAGDLNGVNQVLTELGEPTIGKIEDVPFALATFEDAFMALKNASEMTAGPEQNFDNFKVVGNQLYDLSTEGGPTVVGSSQQTPGFSVTTPDGTTVTHGWQGNVPPGQNTDTTGTPRNSAQLSKELSKKDAAALEETNTAARTATDIESLATQLETIAPQVGYTGPGGQAYGLIDDVVGFLPGDSGARGAFKSLAMEAQLTFTEKTKGAITDREMGMFRAAVPNLGQTSEGNKAIAQVMKAAGARTQTRAAFFENWARKHGSLEGAQEVWSDYMRDNPLITEDGNSIKANPEGDWQSYLTRQPAMSYTPEAILQMDINQLSMMPVEKMTGPQLDALERRFQELGR